MAQKEQAGGMEREWREIRNAADVTEEHIQAALDARDGLYGNTGTPMPWEDVITAIESGDEDWGSDMESDAIRYLKKQVRERS